jgi:hypothetical protein
MDSGWESFNKALSRLGIKPTDRVLLARISVQAMQLTENGVVVRSYAISTSKRPPSNVKDSLGTPRGLHAIAERIGGGQPAGMVFRNRLPTGLHYSEVPGAEESNLITSRILWLRGLEPGVNEGDNVDTHGRYIYIHGTQREDKVGTPVSAGCILLSNADVIDLYDRVRTGDLVWIGD